VPWHHIAVSGFITDPDRKKMSKSKGNVITPLPLLDEYTADGVRYWAASARLGVDTALDEQVFKIGKRLVTKLFNAGKFALAQEAEIGPISEELDRAFAAKLRALVLRSTRHFESFQHAPVLQEVESFFWSHFTDTYLELAKLRARSEDPAAAAGRGSAVATLRLGLDVLLRLFAPFVPFISEEVWSWAFAAERGQPSIHAAPWPSERDFSGVAEPDAPESFDLAVACWSAILKAKSDGAVSMGREVERLVIAANAVTLAALPRVLPDVLAAARCHSHVLATDDALADGTFAIRDAVFAERAED
jgi:valyl-tRNA synthetase